MSEEHKNITSESEDIKLLNQNKMEESSSDEDVIGISPQEEKRSVKQESLPVSTTLDDGTKYKYVLKLDSSEEESDDLVSGEEVLTSKGSKSESIPEFSSFSESEDSNDVTAIKSNGDQISSETLIGDMNGLMGTLSNCTSEKNMEKITKNMEYIQREINDKGNDVLLRNDVYDKIKEITDLLKNVKDECLIKNLKKNNQCSVVTSEINKYDVENLRRINALLIRYDGILRNVSGRVFELYNKSLEECGGKENDRVRLLKNIIKNVKSIVGTTDELKEKYKKSVSTEEKKSNKISSKDSSSESPSEVSYNIVTPIDYQNVTNVNVETKEESKDEPEYELEYVNEYRATFGVLRVIFVVLVILLIYQLAVIFSNVVKY